MDRRRIDRPSILEIPFDRRTALVALLATAGGCAAGEKTEMSQAAGAGSYDLGAVFDAHVRHEFVDKDLDATMRTMTADPYVFHVPTMTGGVGWDDLRAFYGTHFIGRWPDDTEVQRVSRTVGANQVVDELALTFTHDREIPILLPGIAPTGRAIALPHAVVMGFGDGLVAHEHIYYDQASALVQAGLLDPARAPALGGEQAERFAEIAAQRKPAPGTNDGHDLGAAADRHLRLAFVDRDIAGTMQGMTEDAYVWAVPTAAGGTGPDAVRRFCAERAASLGNPSVTLVSRTVGVDQVVAEFILSFAHDYPIESMLPGVAPTGRRVAMPLVAVMGFKDGQIAHQHLYWDQASVLVQVRLLDPAKLPVVGAEAARWLNDRSPPLNRLLQT